MIHDDGDTAAPTLKNLKTIQKKLDFSNIQGTVSKTTKTLVVKSLVKKNLGL